MVVMLCGMLDYGWYFWREALLINGLRESVRAGSLQLPTSSETGAACAACTTAAKSALTSALTSQGYATSVSSAINPSITRIPASGTPCSYAIVVDTTVAHKRLVTLVPGPSSFKVRVVSMAQNLKCP